MKKMTPSLSSAEMIHSLVLRLSLTLLLAVIVVMTSSKTQAESTPKPKYGPQATPLSLSRDYFKKSNAPDFWALIPYYVPQQDSRSCSVATLTMLVNATRSSLTLTASDELVTQKSILEKTNLPLWLKGVGEGGKGVTLDELYEITLKSLKNYGYTQAKVELIRLSSATPQMIRKITQVLTENEKSTSDFIIANFLQSEYTGDPEGAVGHIAPVAAYDASLKRVLILDPDRQYYEPYWISEATFIKGMTTRDSVSQKNRGLLWVKLGSDSLAP